LNANDNNSICVMGDEPRPKGDEPRPKGDEPRPKGDEPRPKGDEPRPKGDEPRPKGDRQSPTVDELNCQLIYFDDLFGIRDNFMVKKYRSKFRN
jgi:hypothetical protein